MTHSTGSIGHAEQAKSQFEKVEREIVGRGVGDRDDGSRGRKRGENVSLKGVI